MSAIKYSPDLGLELTKYRSCDRCGINMQISVFSHRKQCDDCIDYEVWSFGEFDWLFGRSTA